MKHFLTTKQKMGLGCIAILFALNVVAWNEVFLMHEPHYLKVEVLNIGQGDAIFIETPDKHHILIDGGPNSAVLEKLAARLPFWDRSLDMIILTHPDADHLVGLLKVLKKYRVDYIVWTGIVRDGANYQEWLALLKESQENGSKIVIAKQGTQILSGNVIIKTLNPPENLQGKFFGKTSNDTGIVSQVTYGKNSFLFTADISSKVEQNMVAAGLPLTSDVLKVAHHGSKYSSSPEFLEAVNPSIAVISAGVDNSYGHPTFEVLQKLSGFGIKILRTDQDGTVQMLSDGIHIKINKEKNT